MTEEDKKYLELPISMAFICRGRLGDFSKIKEFIDTLEETDLIYCKQSPRKKLYVQIGEPDDSKR